MKKDGYLFGILVGLGSILLTALLEVAVFCIFGIPFSVNLKFFLIAFVPAIVLLRYYSKNLQLMQTAKSIAVVLFLTLTAYIIFLVRSAEVFLK